MCVLVYVCVYMWVCVCIYVCVYVCVVGWVDRRKKHVYICMYMYILFKVATKSSVACSQRDTRIWIHMCLISRQSTCSVRGCLASQGRDLGWQESIGAGRMSSRFHNISSFLCRKVSLPCAHQLGKIITALWCLKCLNQDEPLTKRKNSVYSFVVCWRFQSPKGYKMGGTHQEGWIVLHDLLFLTNAPNLENDMLMIPACWMSLGILMDGPAWRPSALLLPFSLSLSVSLALLAPISLAFALLSHISLSFSISFAFLSPTSLFLSLSISFALLPPTSPYYLLLLLFFFL